MEISFSLFLFAFFTAECQSEVLLLTEFWRLLLAMAFVGVKSVLLALAKVFLAISCKWTNLVFCDWSVDHRSRIHQWARKIVAAREKKYGNIAKERPTPRSVKFISFQFPCTTWHQQTMSQQKHLLVSKRVDARLSRALEKEKKNIAKNEHFSLSQHLPVLWLETFWRVLMPVMGFVRKLLLISKTRQHSLKKIKL